MVATVKPTQKQAEASIRKVGTKTKASALVLAIALGAAIKEGISLDVYDDGLGIPTVCFGQTGKAVKFGQPPRVLDECSEALLARIEVGIAHLDTKIGPIRTPAGPITFNQLTAGEQEAFLSLYDNVGDGKYGVKDGLFAQKKADRVSIIVSRLRAGDRWGACMGIFDWKYPQWRGIQKRRQNENATCLRDLVAAK